MTFKLSPLSLFLILLIVLFVSYFIGNWFYSPEKENFISFDYGASIGSSIQIPQYSGTSTVNKVAKVYDNVFYDVYNGNLIEVDGSAYKGNSEITGSSISNVYILGRAKSGSSLSSYKTQANNQIVQTAESQITFTKSFKEFTYKTQSQNTNPYVVFYLPWNDTTYIHMIDICGGIQNHKHMVTELYYPTSQNNITYTNSMLKFPSGKSMDDFNSSNNNFVRLPAYDPSYSIFQMTSNIFFDVRNAQIVITNPDTNTLLVYPRKYDMTDSSLIKSGNYTAQTSVISTDFNAWSAYDLSNKGNKMVLYISVATKTMVVIIEPDNSNGYRLFNVKRFSNTGIDNGDASVSLTSPSSNINTLQSTPDSMMSDYYKWFYHNSVKGIKDTNSHNMNYSDDYILKTQIVPPVCPSCPSCPSCPASGGGDTCTNCGGNGGSGMVGVDQSTDINQNGANSSIPGQPISNVANATTNSVNNAVNATAGVAKNLINTTGNLLYSGASGTKHLVEGTGKGVKHFVENTGKGALDAAGYVGKGALDVAGNVGKGALDVAGNIGNTLLTTNATNIDDVNADSQPVDNNNRNFNDNDINRLGYLNSNGSPIINNSSVTDPYSYFGAVPSKPSLFMPITSDFSKFGR